MKTVFTVLWISFCLGYFLFRADAFIRANSATFDEAVHLSAGYSYWSRGDFRLNHETPPLSKLIAALPLFIFKHPKFEPTPQQWDDSAIWQIGNDFVFRNRLPPEEMLAWGRWATVPEGVALILLIGWWTYRCFGYLAGLFALALASLEPNLLAFSCIVNSDMCFTLFTFASAYCSWEYFRNPKRIWFVLSGIFIGFSLASKFSALFFIPGLLACWAILLKANRFTAIFRLGLIATLCVAISYFGFQFPQFGMGLKQQLSRNDFDPPEFYYLGEISSTGWWGYFVHIIWLKTLPLYGFLAALYVLCHLVLVFERKKFPGNSDRVFFLIPPTLFLFVMTALKVDLGIRIALPFLPFLILAGSFLFEPVDRSGKHKRLIKGKYFIGFLRIERLIFSSMLLALIIIGIGFLCSRVITGRELSCYFGPVPVKMEVPLYLPDETIEGAAARTFGDSNLDWGQDLLRLKKWMEESGRAPLYLAYTGSAPPEAYGIDFIPLPAWGRVEPLPKSDGKKSDFVAVSVSCLQGLHLKERNMYSILRNKKPVTYLGGAIWIYDIREHPEIRAEIERLAEQASNGQ